MNLEFIKYDGSFTEEELVIAELIQRRRLQILINSYLYYDTDVELVTDRTYDLWGKELAKLQNNYPDIANKICYAKAFKGWTGITGFNLPKDSWVINKSLQLIRGIKGNKKKEK